MGPLASLPVWPLFFKAGDDTTQPIAQKAVAPPYLRACVRRMDVASCLPPALSSTETVSFKPQF